MCFPMEIGSVGENVVLATWEKWEHCTLKSQILRQKINIVNHNSPIPAPCVIVIHPGVSELGSQEDKGG